MTGNDLIKTTYGLLSTYTLLLLKIQNIYETKLILSSAFGMYEIFLWTCGDPQMCYRHLNRTSEFGGLSN
jgi:hypothetical protein